MYHILSLQSLKSQGCNWYEFKETCQVLGYHGAVVYVS